MLSSESVASVVLDKLQTLSGNLATAVAGKDEARTKLVCAQMNSLIEVLESLAIPNVEPDLSNLQRHIRFPEFYATRHELEKASSDPADCLTDIAGIREKLAGVQPASQAWWQSIHPAVRVIAEPRYRAGHLADSVEAALKEVNSRVKKEYQVRTRVEVDGRNLMMKAFSLDNPKIVLADLTTESGRNEQEGYMFLFAGAMQALRNPKAHANLDIDEVRARHHLFVASLLMFELDEVAVPP